LPNLAPPGELGTLALGRRAVENEREFQSVIGDEPRDAIEEAVEVRGDAALRIAQRRAVAEPNEREELVQLRRAVDG
jgi:hypothetical protein